MPDSALSEASPHELARPADTPPAAGAARKVESRQLALTVLLLAALLLPWVAAALEWRYYRDTAGHLLGRRPWRSSEVAVVWVLFAKTYLLLLPALLLAAAAVARGWWRSGAALFALATCAAFAWGEVDRQLYARTGAHLHDYAQFAREPGALQWAGSLSTSLARTREALTSTAKLAALAVLLSIAAATVAARRWPAAMHRAALALAALHAVTLLGVTPAQYAYPHREDLQRLHAILPFRFTWTAPGMGLIDVRRFTDPLNDHLRPTLVRSAPALRGGPPADVEATLPAGAPKPDVVLVVLDSLRADALVPEVMPRLAALSKSGLRLNQHYAGARISHFGLFTILYGRPAVAYHPTLDARVQPQACVTLRRGGYVASYVSGMEYAGWMGMERYIDGESFDRIRVLGVTDWPRSDRRALSTVSKMLQENNAAGADRRPQFLVTFLVSTHLPYRYPPEFERRTPVLPENWGVLTLDPTRDRVPLLNRYHNACGYADEIVADFIAGLDLSRTVVVVTGDHGESFWDDGVIAHGWRWSDAQAHVPCFIVGTGIAPREVAEPTEHQDLAPTLVHAAAGAPVVLRNVTGRDLLGEPLRPRATVIAGSSDPKRGEMVVEFRGRRLLIELPHDRPEVVVRGTVNRVGDVDPWDIPPASEARDWAEALGDLLGRMTNLPHR